MMVPQVSQQLRKKLSPVGTLRVAINLSNALFVTGKDQNLPVGVAPDVAALLSKYVQLPLQLVPFPHPDTICESAEKEDAWDVALIGADPLRANRISFTKPYCEIQACFMTRNKAQQLQSLSDIDLPNKRIVVKGGGAYDLWLQQNLQNADTILVREKTIVESFQRFRDDPSIDALAGLRSMYIDKKEHLPDDGVAMDWNFMSVQQSIGVRKRDNDDETSMKDLMILLNSFVDNLLSEKIIAELINKHDVTGKLFPSKL